MKLNRIVLVLLTALTLRRSASRRHQDGRSVRREAGGKERGSKDE